MSRQAPLPGGPRVANGNDKGVVSASRRSSNPLDLEKGQAHMSDFSEDDKELGDSAVLGPVLTSEPEKRDSADKDNNNSRQGTLRKHWRPSKAWFILVFVGLGVCWIPAILAWKKFPKARVWGVKLLFWSIWLSILWAGWWFALVVSWIWHRVLLIFVHLFGVWKLKRYVNWLEYLHGYFALVAWTAALWITWVPLIADRQIGNTGEQDSGSNGRSVRAVNLSGRLLFALAGCAAILLAEKVAIQWIAMKFHARSYQRRIDIQKEAVKAFKVLFSFVSDNTVTPSDKGSSPQKISRNPSQWSNNTYRPFSTNQQYSYGIHIIDRIPTSKLQTAFTDVTGQIFGTSQLDHDDVVGRAFHRDGSKKMRMLCQDIWRGIANKSGNTTSSTSPVMMKSTIEELCRGVPDRMDGKKEPLAEKVWNVVTGGLPHLQSIREEDFANTCSDLHAEQRRLEETMNDLQNVVGRLDDLLMLFWFVGSILIFAVALEAELKTLVFSAGSVFIGSSWLLRDTAGEVLSSIIFLFSKHPFDVDDAVIIQGKWYTVKEMRLLSTVFHDGDSVQVQAPNSLLNTLFINNLRRSPAISEPFIIEVNDKTTEAQLDDFQARMISFLQAHPKDYRADFEVLIKELSYQSHKMILSMEIKYNNSWQSKIDVRTKQHNAWICAVRECLSLAGIQGPAVPALRVTTSAADVGSDE